MQRVRVGQTTRCILLYNTVNPCSAGLTYKAHSWQQREIRCEGSCGRIKLVGRFIKAQRNNSASWCIQCTEWKETSRNASCLGHLGTWNILGGTKVKSTVERHYLYDNKRSTVNNLNSFIRS
ncbi:hypothetical protein F5Y03DRAFT_362235 [Xylaria venustula]|nr:hypothetical protein F5Y03DRAFT_362235 [Xylaria venustula]